MRTFPRLHPCRFSSLLGSPVPTVENGPELRSVGLAFCVAEGRSGDCPLRLRMQPDGGPLGTMDGPEPQVVGSALAAPSPVSAADASRKSVNSSSGGAPPDEGVSVTVSVRIRPFLQREQGRRRVTRIRQPDPEKGKVGEKPTIALDVLTSQLACRLGFGKI